MFNISHNDNKKILDLYMTSIVERDNLLAAAASIGDYTLTFTGGHSAAVDQVVTILEDGKHSQAEITNVATNTITLDTPIDNDFTTAAVVILGNEDLNLAGSMASPVIAYIEPPPDAIWHITRTILNIEDQSAMDTATFGGIAALSNGVVLRTQKTTPDNIYNVKSNGEFALRAYDVEYDLKAPAGFYGFRCRRSFAGKDKQDAQIRTSFLGWAIVPWQNMLHSILIFSGYRGMRLK